MKWFDISEFDCKETGENEMRQEFLIKIDRLRNECGFPLTINSGFRSKRHSIEKAKEKPGYHTKGIAADIRCTSDHQRHLLLDYAYSMGFSGVGIYSRWIHLDIAPRRATWVGKI